MDIVTLKQYLDRLGLKTKIFFSFLVVILLLSGVIALFTRWILISSLTNELQLRGLGIAQSLAESSRGFILTKNFPRLTSLIFDARIGGRRQLVGYIFVLNKQEQIIAHTFTHPFPKGLSSRNRLDPEKRESIRLLKIEGDSLYDIAVSINEGIYRIGTIHVGLKKLHIDQLIGKLRITFLGFLSLMTILFFGISHLLSRYITHPISELTRISDEIARDDSGIEPFFTSTGFKCWEIKDCEKFDCPAFENSELPCWYLDGTMGYQVKASKFPEKLATCKTCDIYQKYIGDEVAQLAHSFTNMTMRLKLKEAQLKESEQDYRLLVDNLPNIVFKGYADGTIDFFDDKIELLIGYPKQDFIQRRITWFDIIFESDLENAQEKFKQALKGDVSYVREYRLKSKKGQLIWVEESSQIICDPNGRISFISGAFLNITERKKAEEALFLSEEKYRHLFDSGPTPVFVLDSNTLRILDANPIAEETYGYSKSELYGKPFSELGPLGFELSVEAFEQIESGKEMRLVGHKELHYKKGNLPFYVRVTACPVRYKDRIAIILATSDITEVIEKDAQLAQASKMTILGEMSAGIAHELNQPLNAIKMGNEYLKLMLDSQRDIPPEDLHHVASEVSNQVDRASEIINRLRDFSRKPQFEKVAVNINQPIRGALSILEQQLNLLDIEVQTDLDERIPMILAQNNPLEQVFFNLITNARDAITQKASESHKNRVIAIRTFSTKGQVIASVEDTGLGIPEELLERILEPFFTTKEVGKGMGLGLYITYGIVRDYEGEIDIQSRLGEGTTIKVIFPSQGQGVE